MNRTLPSGLEIGTGKLEGGANGEAASFLLLGPSENLAASGVAQRLEAGSASSLAARVAAFFAARDGGPDLLVGALPYDREAQDFLFQPRAVVRGAAARQFLPQQTNGQAADDQPDWLVTQQPSVDAYRSAVSRALGLFSRGDLRKVVLSRSLLVEAAIAIDDLRLVGNLVSDPSTTTFRTLLALPGGAATPRLVGATPELLVSKSGSSVVSHPLAGSARRRAESGADREAGLALERSAKDRHEHSFVIEQVLDTLSPYCSQLGVPDGTALKATATMWHLGTRIAGTLKDERTSAAELAAALHPTPAVCGAPRLAAAQAIRELEGYDRGFYAGAVGWCDARGDGNWYVSLRCAEIAGSQARLYSGAGIVPGSDPDSEADETSAKFLAMLGALGVDEHGRALRARAA